MKILLLILFTSTANASTCYVIDKAVQSPSVIYQYPGPCNQAAFSGKVGDANQSTHLIDTDFQTLTTTNLNQSAVQSARITRLKAACAGLAGQALQDLCNEVVNGK